MKGCSLLLRSRSKDTEPEQEKDVAEFEFDDLKKEYEHFGHPVVSIEINGEEFENNQYGLGVSDIRVELSAGFEASMASFVIYNVYDQVYGTFVFDRFKKYVLLGSSVVIYTGYSASVREVFRGFIAKVNFIYDEDDIPGVMVTAMDMKGIMMTNNSSKQLKSKTYSAALKEILGAEPYSTLISNGVIKAYKISDTPDGQMNAAASGGMGAIAGAASGIASGALEGAPGASEAGNAASQAGSAQSALGEAGELAGGTNQQSSDVYTVEMVGESDYEFFVRTAKRFNYDFFILGGELIFRPAKSDTAIYMNLSVKTGMRNINVEYDITGLFGKVEVRNVDPGKGKIITSTKKFSNKISQGSKAKGIVGNLEKVFIDPTVSSKDDASYRANYLVEDMSYRFGTLEADIIGLPELVPGRFIQISGLGKDVENQYYLQEVIHTINGDGDYITKIIGKAATISDSVGVDSVTGGLNSATGAISNAAGAISGMGGLF